MSKTLLVILVILAPIVASSQCVFRVDGKDPITNQEVKRHDFYLSGSFEVTLSRKHDTYEFIVDFELDGEQNYSIPPGTKTIIKLINGDIIEVLSNNSAPPVTKIGRSIVSRFMLTHDVSIDFYKKLASSSVQHIRIELQDQMIDTPVKSKAGAKISKYADCITQ